MFLNIIKVFLFGIVQGVTEFLPVSSSGHLVILHKIFPELSIDPVLFDVSLHLASLLALLYFFRKDIVSLLKAFIYSFFGKRSNESRLAWLLFFATIPAALAGFFGESYIENSLRILPVIIFMLALIAVFFIIVEKLAKQKTSWKDIGISQALSIGVAQAFALIPGTSRSGITIIAGLAIGLKRESAVRFSFLLAAPIIFGAGIKKILDLIQDFSIYNNGDFILIVFGFMASLVSSFLAIKYFVNFSKRNTLKPFAYYRLILAFILLLSVFFIRS